MAGSLTLSLAQQFDINGQPLAGALLYFYEVGTVSTPQNSYSDFGLTIINPYPLIADQYGRIPNFYLADGSVAVRLTDATGVVIYSNPNMQVIGPSSGSGGGSGVDPSTIASTGDVKFRPTSETLTGWVKLNGQTIGNVSSGATQLANSSAQSLFIYLWQNFTNAHCPVAGGRGSSGLSDFQTNKTIQLPDFRSTALVGLDDMGATAAGQLLASNVTSGNGDGVTTPGAKGGEANHLLLLGEAPRGQFTLNDPGHAHGPSGTTSFLVAPGGSTFQAVAGNQSYGQTSSTTTNTTGVSLNDNSGGGAHNNMPPFILGTWFMHL